MRSYRDGCPLGDLERRLGGRLAGGTQRGRARNAPRSQSWLRGGGLLETALFEPGGRVAEEDPGAAHVLIPRDRFGLSDGFAEGQPRTQPLEETAVHVHLLSRLTQ